MDSQLDVLAVGAHPDDVEIGCGGTLAALVRQGYRVGIVDLTDGEPTPGSPGPEVRLAEARQAAEILGVHVRTTLDLPNRRLFDCFETRVALAKEFRRWRPKIVMGLAGKTPMASPDHFEAMKITDAAVFYSRLTKWDEYFDGLPVHAIARQVYYHLGFEQGMAPHPYPSFIVDISDTLAIKIESIETYKTQFPPNKSYVLDRVRSMALAAGAAAGVAAGEVLQSTKPFVTHDMVEFLRASR